MLTSAAVLPPRMPVLRIPVWWAEGLGLVQGSEVLGPVQGSEVLGLVGVLVEVWLVEWLKV